jgi:hypothetical protein
MDDERIAELAADLGCGSPLVTDLLRLAGGDVSLVREASRNCSRIESVKAYIIDKRIARVE